MKVIKIKKSEWTGGLDAAGGAYRVIAPVKEKQFSNFKALAKGEAPDMAAQNTRLSAKGVVYPQSETMFCYTLDESQPDHHVMKDADKDYSPRAIVGIRPCDAAAFVLVKRNFDTPEYQDPYWLNAHAATTFIGQACNRPCGTCFCTTANTGPFDTSALDVMLVDNGDHYLAQVMTKKGEAFMKAAGWKTAAGTDAGAAIDTLRGEAEAKIASEVHTDHLAGLETTDLYEALFWEDVSFSCINCGTCTFVCPTCWCFAIQDENRG